MTLAKRVITHTALLRQLVDPWRYLPRLREQIANAINHATLSA
jgi:hypothetical protein